MIVKYLPGVYTSDIKEDITVNVSGYELEDNLLLLSHPQLRGGEELFDLDKFTLMGSKFRKLTIFRIFQNILLLMAGIVAAANIVNDVINAKTGNISQAVMLFASIGFSVFSGFNVKTLIEKYLYGGVFSKGVEIYFQTEEEKNKIGRYFENAKTKRQ